MYRSGFKLIFFFLFIIPNLVICLDKYEDCRCNIDSEIRIVGGSIGKLSGMAAVILDANINDELRMSRNVLMKLNYFRCSAFMLNEKWVMTTRECTKVEGLNYTVGVGYDKLEMFDKRIKVKNIINKDGFDISLLELVTPINLTEFKPVCLDVKKYDQFNIKNFIGAGLGEILPHKQDLLSQEIVSAVPTVHQVQSRYSKEIELVKDDKKCDDEFKLCVKSATKKRKRSGNFEEALCFGDQGGPLYYLSRGKRFVVGLLTEIIPSIIGNRFSYFCEGDGEATYLKIAPHIDWIKEKLGENNYCDKEWAEKETQRSIVNLAFKWKYDH